MSKANIPVLLKIAAVGAKGVGKSAIIEKISEKTLGAAGYISTGVGFSSKTVLLELDPNTTFEIQIAFWNLNHLSRLEMVRKHFLHGVMGTLLFFDLTKPETLETAKNYLKDSKDVAGEDLPFVLIGTNIDIIDKDEIEVKREQYQRFVKKEGGFYYETSIDALENIDEAINQLARQGLKYCINHKQIELNIDLSNL